MLVYNAVRFSSLQRDSTFNNETQF